MKHWYQSAWFKEREAFPPRKIFLALIFLNPASSSYFALASECFEELDQIRNISRGEEDLT